jgi:hypothetical protein
LNSLFNYKIPNRKKWLLTDAFLTTFKEELDRVFEVYEKLKTYNKEGNPTYWNTYNYLESTYGFYKALKIASEKHNVKKAIYEYANQMPWYHSDVFDGQLTVMMYRKNIIEEGSIDEDPYITTEELIEMEKRGEIEWIEEVSHYKDYYVTRRDWRFVEKPLETQEV